MGLLHESASVRLISFGITILPKIINSSDNTSRLHHYPPFSTVFDIAFR